MRVTVMKNKLHPTHFKTRACAACAAVCAVLLLLSGQSKAQAVYRVVGPDGKVTFSDKPPAPSDKVIATGPAGQSGGDAGAALPYELRQVANKYPVTLYTSSNCVPCGSGRALLSNRGVPFAEKTVNTSEDSEALQRISGESSLPFLTIGGQQIKGYSDAEWTQFLDAAGYPKASVLPASYRGPAATPLVAVQKPAPAVKPEATQTPRAPAAPSRPAVATPANPAGITF
jgi:glutaredoxin